MKSWYGQPEKLFDIFQVPAGAFTAGFHADFPMGILLDAFPLTAVKPDG